MPHTKNLAAERQQYLHDFIREQGAVRVDELCAELHVSPATIRRDLEVLEEQGRIQRVHGGAVSIESRLEEPLFDDKTAMAAREKRNIAERALQFINSGDTIYLDGGSTVLELARMLRDRKDLTVVTHSLRAALELSGSGPRVIVIGGELRRRSQTMVGSLTRLMLDQMHIDKAFMGTIGFSIECGLTTTDPNEAFTKELVMKQSNWVGLLVDSGKTGKVSFAHAGALSDLNAVITDHALPTSFQQSLDQQGIQTHIA